MSNSVIPTEKSDPKKLLLLGLLASVFAVNVIDVFVPLLLPEIAQTFGIARGTASSLGAFSAIAGVIAGLSMSAFSLRIRYKTLLVSGVLCVFVCVLGVFLAPNFLFAQIFYALNGVGSVMVGVMATTLIGEFYPLERKAVRVSWIVATGTLATVIGNPVTGFIANTGGISSWRNALLWFMIPVTAICLILAVFLVPSMRASTPMAPKKSPFLNGYKQVLSNRSALACLSNSFLAGAWFGISIFQLAFLRDVFGISPFLASIVPIVGGSLIVAGMLVGGFLVNKVGRKRLLVAGAIPAILLVVSGYVITIFIPDIWIVLAFRFTSAFIGGWPIVAGPNLAMEQAPMFRGTMMSLGSALNGIGGAVGIFLGGAVLNYFNNPALGYPALAATLGGIGISGTVIVLLFAKDPCRPQTNPHLP
jgi:MFS transporter, DHA1 family, inner membrane transport protein